MTCDQLGTCCGCCEGYTCGDCYFCRQAGCDPQGMNGACPGSPAEPCCYCAPKCLLVIIGGIVMNGNRDCYDCCYKPSSPGSLSGGPCASGDDCCPPCDPYLGTVENPDCKRRANCAKQCPNNDACGHFNGTYIIEMSEWDTCECAGGWRLNTWIYEPPQPISPCCTEANENWEEGMDLYCVEGACPPPGPGPCGLYGTCCPDPCYPSGFDGYGNPLPCPTGPLFDCVARAGGETYSACGAKNAEGAAQCGGPWSMQIYSCMNLLNSGWPLYLSGFSWVADVYMNGIGSVSGYDWTFKREWWEGTDWPLGEDVFGGWINCAGVGALPRVYASNPTSACDWSQNALPVVAIGCPVVFWQEPQQLYLMKDGEKYINLSEVKRRKLVKKTQDSIKKLKIADINIQQEDFSLKEDFRQIVQDSVLQVMMQNDPEKFEEAKIQAEIDMENQMKNLILHSRHKPKNVRASEEILDIYENTCKNCPYFSEDSSVCMLNNKTIKKGISLDNMLMDADAECPDYPPRWGKTTNLEPIPKRPERSERPRPSEPASHPKIL